jgi:8-oxo-dGTP pyrophosphatase MutT (NUDIX family)
MIHPELDENGRQVTINHPHTASGENTWHDTSKVATFTPGSPAPHYTTEAHKPVEHNEAIEKPFTPHPHLKTSAGAIIDNGDGRVWVKSPTNGFGGYKNTFPKGRVDHGESLQQAAAREVHEETGLNVHLTGHLGDYDRSTTRTRYYIGHRTGGSPSSMGWESQAMHLVPVHQLHHFMDSESDKKIARDYQAHVAQKHKVKSVLSFLKNSK